MTNIHKSNVSVLVFWDVINLTLVYSISLYFFRINDMYFESIVILFLLFLILVSLWLVIGYTNMLYVDWDTRSFYKSRLTKYFKTYFILAGVIGIVFLIFSFPKEVRNLLMAVLLGIPSLGVITNSLIIRTYTPIKDRRIKMSTTLIAGSGPLARRVANTLESSSYAKLTIQGFIDCNSKGTPGKDGVVTNLDSLKDYLKGNFAEEIIIALPYKDLDKIKSIVQIADYHGTRIRFIPDYKGIFGENVKSFQFGDLQVVNVRQLPLDNWFLKLLKSIFDILFATITLICLSPLFIVIGVWIKLDSPGPIFYCPIRIGKGGKPFKLYKFRTMQVCDNAFNGSQSTVINDPRITTCSKFLRKFSLDELPQFFNILTREMSVVGPRPHRMFLNQVMQESQKKYMVRHYYKPGITGWAQVNGWRGPLETERQKKQRTSHDLWYLKNWTFWLDIRIIWLTIFGKKTHKTAF